MSHFGQQRVELARLRGRSQHHARHLHQELPSNRQDNHSTPAISQQSERNLLLLFISIPFFIQMQCTNVRFSIDEFAQYTKLELEARRRRRLHSRAKARPYGSIVSSTRKCYYYLNETPKTYYYIDAKQFQKGFSTLMANMFAMRSYQEVCTRQSNKRLLRLAHALPLWSGFSLLLKISLAFLQQHIKQRL